MFKIEKVTDQEYALSGRLDAVEVEKHQPAFETITTSVVFDCVKLEYISSAGLGLLIATQIRLKKSGSEIKLTHVAKFVRDVLRFSGLDKILEVQDA